MLNMPYLPLSGATMTGPLTLEGEPTAAEQAATKLYVDTLQALVDAQAAQITALETRVAALENPPPPP